MTLAGEILRLFKRACVDGDMEVADKLLQALELIDARGFSATTWQGPLAEAYRAVDQLPTLERKRPRHH